MMFCTKRIFAMLLVLLLVLPIAGCSAKEAIEQKAAEAVGEKILEDAGAEDVDIDGDTMTIKGEDGEEVTIGGEKWPDSELGRSIPKFEKGRIDGTVETPNSLMITLYEVKQEDAAAYIEENKPNFPLENMEANADDMITWAGTNDAGLTLMLTHTDDSFSITLAKKEE